VTSGDLFKVTEKTDGSGHYNAVVAEDSSPTGDGALIELRDIFKTPNDIDSYDNLFSNDKETSPVSDTSVASETVTVTITHLGADFYLDGATLVSGTGINRIYTVDLADLKSGATTIKTPVV